MSPASTPTPAGVETGVDLLRSWGLVVEVGEHALAEHGDFLAGADADRLADLNRALRDPGVRAVFATRGGKGAYRLVAGLDYEAMAEDPIPLVGFSEITFLHLAFWRRCGVVGFHGPMVNWDFELCDRASADLLRRAVMEPEPVTFHRDGGIDTAAINVDGTATGVLLGGCLDGVRSSLGWNLPGLDGAIVFIEEVGCDQIGRVDRSLTQLTASGVLDRIAGVVLGTFTGYDERPDRLALTDIIGPYFDRLGVPVLGGIPIGHGVVHLPTLPLGVRASIDVSAGTLTVETGAV